MTELHPSDRRKFLRAAARVSAGTTALTLLPESVFASDDQINIIGPKPGYAPQVRNTRVYVDVDANGNPTERERLDSTRSRSLV